MNFYQVNQRISFEREFNSGYLCCPDGGYGGWPLMKKLKKGDILFHYNSKCGAILGVSWVAEVSQHKGTASEISNVVPGTQCIQYYGTHLSEDDMSLEERMHYQRYDSFLEVHAFPIDRGNFGKLRARSPQRYLLPIDDAEARNFIERSRIHLDELR